MTRMRWIASVLALAGIVVAVVSVAEGGHHSVATRRSYASALRKVAARPQMKAAAPSILRKSAHAFARQSDRAAGVTAQTMFDGVMRDPGWPDLRADRSVKIERVLRGNHAAVVSVDGHRAVVSSMLPLSLARGHAAASPVSTRLSVRGGSLVPANTLSGYQMTRSLSNSGPTSESAAISFPRAGFTLSPGSGSDAQVVSGKAFWGNLARDTDFIATPLPTGVEAMWQLRSANSPTQLDLRIQGVDVVDIGADKSASLVRDGRRVGTISPPSARDADGRPVGVSWHASGSSLVLDVDHRRDGVRYPVLVDPYVADDQRYWVTSTTIDFGGWTFSGNTSYVAGAPGVGSYGNGLNLAVYPRASGIPAGTIGHYDFTARAYPGPHFSEGAHIFKADFGYTYANVAGTGGSCWEEGLYDNTGQQWEPQGKYRTGAVSDPYTFYPVSGGIRYPFLSCSNEGVPRQGTTYGYRVHCLSTCDLTGGDPTRGAPGNAARLSINPVLGGSTGAVVYMGSALVFQSEQYPPKIQASAAPTGWTDATTFGVDGVDYGLGTTTVSASAPGWAGAISPPAACINAVDTGPPEGGTPGSANYGDRNHQCHQTETATINTATMPEGSYPVAVHATDVLDNAADTTIPLKVDHGGPTITPSGTLYDARNGFVGPNQNYTLSVVATDGSMTSAATQRSGTTALAATLDGLPITSGSAAAPCTRPEGSCALTINAALTAAQIQALDDGVAHTINITAADALGHAATPVSFTFRIDNTPPTSFSSGDLLKVSGSPLTEDIYHLDVEARDNAPTDPEVDDDGVALAPDSTPGAGLKDLVVRLDNQVVATTTIACFSDPDCESARHWTWDLSGTSNGSHTITVTAADKVNNEDIDTIQVDVERQPDQPARTNTDIQRTIVGAASNDRTGSAVAAVGDVNGDGYTDYLVGAPGVTTSGRASAGAAYLVLGTSDPSTLDLAAPGASAVRFLGPGSNQYCGTAVAAAGDINGDGLDDMLIGCPGLDSRVGAITATGRVYVVFGRPDPQAVDLANIATAGFVITGPTDTLDLGLPLLTSRATVFGERLQSVEPDQVDRDINNDGYDDIVIGDSAVTQAGKVDAGAVYVIYGKADNATVDVTALGDQGFTIRGSVASSLTGYSATITDDITGDTVPDIVVGAPGATSTTGGRAYVIKGDPSGGDVDLAAPGSRAITLTSGQPYDRFGVNVAALGDTDLDTVPDIAIGTSSGAYIVRKLPSTSRAITADDGYRVVGPANDPGLLSTKVPEAPIAAVGDLDGDQRADMIIGYPDTTGPPVYTIRSPDASRTLTVTALPGQRGAAIGAGTMSEGAGLAVSGSTYLGQEPAISQSAQGMVGAPSGAADSSRANAGRAYVVAEPTPTGPGVQSDQVGGGPVRAASTSTRSAAAPKSAARDIPNGLIPGSYTVTASAETEWVTVRNDSQSLVIGSAQDGDSLYADDRVLFGHDSPGDAQKIYYLHGVFGNAVHRCGWIVQKQTVFDTVGVPPADGRNCDGRPKRLPPYRFARLINTEAKGDGTFVRLRNVHSQSTDENVLQNALPAEIPLYRNVRPGTNESALSQDGSLPTTTLQDGHRVRRSVMWRYVTKSGRFALVRVSGDTDLGHNGWVFISTHWLPPTTGRAGSLCDDGSDVFAEPASNPTHTDWAPVCSNKPSWSVPDLP